MTLIADWQKKRNDAAEDEVSLTDGLYAGQCGFPTLAALSILRHRLAHASGQYLSAAEVEAELAKVISVAVGEAQARVEAAGVTETVPGVPTVPQRIFERSKGR